MRGKVGKIDHTNGQLSQVLYTLIGTVIAFGVAALALVLLYGRLPRELARFLDFELREIHKVLGGQDESAEVAKVD